jgi:hypothetical protein
MASFEWDLPCYEISVIGADGGGTVSSTAKDVCPYCSVVDCYADCDGSAGDIDGLESEEETIGREHYNCAIDGIEALILAMACAGIEIDTPAMIEAIETAVEGAANNA